MSSLRVIRRCSVCGRFLSSCTCPDCFEILPAAGVPKPA